MKKIGKLVFWSAIILPVIIAGNRYGIGTDYFNYENIYRNLNNSYGGVLYLLENTRYEPGWIALNLLVEFLFGDIVYLFIISSLLTWVFFFKAIYNHKDKVSVGISILILFCTTYNSSFNGIRQVLATSILLLSITPLLNKRFFKFVFTVLLSACFHYTALIFLPAYWLANSRTGNISLVKKILAPIIFIVAIMFIDPILSFVTSFDIFSSYSNYEVESDGFGIGKLVIRLPIFILILLNMKKLRFKNNPISRLGILYFIGIVLLHLGYFAPHLNRLSGYFELIQVLLVGAIIKSQNNKYEKLIYSYLVIIFYVAWFTYHFLILGNHETVPYQMR